jgi:hypothetical protein
MYKAGDTSDRDLLREFRPSSGELSDMLFSMVSRLLQGSPDEVSWCIEPKTTDGNDTLAPEKRMIIAGRPDHLISTATRVLISVEVVFRSGQLMAIGRLFSFVEES